MQRQWARLARRGRCAGVVPTAPRSLERARREMSHLLVVLCRPGNFVRFLFEVCWLISFFSPEIPVQGELVEVFVVFKS